MPEWTNYRAVTWASYMRKAEQTAVDKLFDTDFEGLRVIAINLEAFRDATKCKAALIVRKLCLCFNVLMCVDESSKIKTPGAKRTMAIRHLGKHADMRRILTGSPITGGPLDIYAQFAFLGQHLLGFDNYVSFSHYFAEWEKETFFNKAKGQLDEFEVLTGYQNIDELNDMIDRHSFRITKDECLDLPEKIYETRYVEMSAVQRKLYNDIIHKSLMEFSDGEEISVKSVLTKLLRVQQVLGGFVPQEKFGDALPIEANNVRINCLMDALAETDGKVIIWARFRAELEAIEKRIKKEYGEMSCVAYHGGVDDVDREIAINRFQGVRPAPNTIADEDAPKWEELEPEYQARFFVGQQHSGGYGITLTAANTVIYFSNDFSLEARLQSEDRAHRIGQHHPVVYIDLEVIGTIDTKILKALRHKMDLAEMITRDAKRIAEQTAGLAVTSSEAILEAAQNSGLALAPPT
jgi:SNF2 family DNA or RNA helicase